VTEQQAKKLLATAIKWQEQGARSKWKSKASLELWDLIEQIKTNQHETVDDIPVERVIQHLLRRAWIYLFRDWSIQ
jgi:hypothetical protein